ncbi:MAG: hypothetical protein RL662_1351 [Bacteroidota bacterium]|jgi:hypothetical protein
MKHILKFTLLVLLAPIFIQCNEYENPSDEFSYGAIANNFKGKEVNINAIYTFQDLSHGVITRTWDFGTDTEFVEGDAQSDHVKVRFTKAGQRYIRFNATYIDNAYKYDTTYVINVLDLVKADFVAKVNDITYTSSQSITLQAGSGVVSFQSKSDGVPAYYQWIMEGSAEGTLEGGADLTSINTNYYLPGKYDVKLIASRDEPWGADTIVVKNYVTITPTNKTARIQSIVQTQDEKLQLAFNLAMKEPKTSDISSFTVVRNGANATIKSLSINTSDATKFVMEIDGGVYNGDDLKVSYTPGSITSQLNTTLESFTSIRFIPIVKNLITNPGFENGTWGNATDGVWAVIPGCGLRTDIVHSGTHSYYINNTSTSGRLVVDESLLVINGLREDKNYVLNFWIYNQTSVSDAECGVRITQEKPSWIEICKNWLGAGTNYSDISFNEWKEITVKFGPAHSEKIRANTDNGRLQFYFSSGFKGYIDDFNFCEIKER